MIFIWAAEHQDGTRTLYRRLPSGAWQSCAETPSDRALDPKAPRTWEPIPTGSVPPEIRDRDEQTRHPRWLKRPTPTGEAGALEKRHGETA